MGSTPREKLEEAVRRITEFETETYRSLATVVLRKDRDEILAYHVRPDANISSDDLSVIKEVFRKAIYEIERGTGRYWTDMYYMMISTDKGFYIVEDYEEGFIIVFVMPKGFLKFTVGERFLELHNELLEAAKEMVST